MSYREADESADTVSPETAPRLYRVFQLTDPLNAVRVTAQMKHEAYRLANLKTIPRTLGYPEVGVEPVDE